MLKDLSELKLSSRQTVDIAISKRPIPLMFWEGFCLHCHSYGFSSLQLHTLGLELGSLCLSVETKPIFMVPFSRNTKFLGRDSILEILTRRLAHTQLPGPQNVQKAALCGLGGIG